MLPALRKKLKNVSSSNQSLQDILQSSKEADAVITITNVETGIHNTQLVLSIINQEPRICFYNRLDIKKIISSAFVSSGNVVNDIKTLNNQGYDFTEDDLEFSRGLLVAKETSLRFFGELKNYPYLRDWVLLIEGTDLRIMTEHNKAILIEER